MVGYLSAGVYPSAANVLAFSLFLSCVFVRLFFKYMEIFLTAGLSTMFDRSSIYGDFRSSMRHLVYI